MGYLPSKYAKAPFLIPPLKFLSSFKTNFQPEYLNYVIS